MKKLRAKLKEYVIAYFNRKSRERFFSYVTSEESFVIKDRKRHYEMLFPDGSITILPKNLFSFIKRWASTDRPSLRIGKNTYLQNLKLDIFLDQSITIGSFCSFGPNVIIKPDGIRGKAQFTSYPLNLIDENSKMYTTYIENIRTTFVKIGNDCFIGEDVKIMSNVIVGDGVIIGERSLVTSGKQLEPFGIYAGVPAKLIGYRYAPEIIAELMHIQWWNWPFEKIFKSGLQNLAFNGDEENILKILRKFS
jgi:acetyltransferase-like isoleucine patch superfamily enzyme